MFDTKSKKDRPENISTETQTPGVRPGENTKSRSEEAEDIRKDTVRVVTEADILNDPRLTAAGVVVGQLYDFSNLPHVKDHALADEVNERNRLKDEAEDRAKSGYDATYPRHTSEVERAEIRSRAAEPIAV